MPTVTVTADLLSPRDVQVAAAFLDVVAKAGLDSALNDPDVAAAVKTVIEKTEATPAAVPEGAVEQSLQDPPQPEKKARASNKKTPEDIVVFDIKGERAAGFAHSKHAADRLVYEWQKSTTLEELDACRKANIGTLARLATADQERIQPLLAEHFQKVKDGKVTPPEPPATTDIDAQLAAAFSPAVPDAPEPEAEKPMDQDDFNKSMLGIAKQLGTTESGAWLSRIWEQQGLEGRPAIATVPENLRATFVAAGVEHVKELAGKTA